MMKKIIIILLVLLACMAGSTVLAQAPGKFKYQAVLRDATGNIIPSTVVTVFIDILQGSASGTSVYNESHTVTTTAQGVINLDIGGGTVVSGVFANINWCANPYWVKVTLNGTVISTGQLMSVPYSLSTKGINVTPLGNVGIGTTNPSSLLHLYNAGPQPNLLVETNNASLGPELRLKSTATGGREWRIVSGASAANSYGAGSFELWDQTAGLPRFGILPNGNIGIGTTNPQNKLHVAGFIQLEGNPDAQILFGTTGANGKRGIGSLAGWDPTKLYINGWGDFTGGVSIGKWGGTVETSDLYVNGNYHWKIGTNILMNGLGSVPTDFTFDFDGASGNEVWGVWDPVHSFILTARNNGRVGIGTDSPTTTLHVAGSVRIVDGTQGTGKLLRSDANGNASWITVAGNTPAVLAVFPGTPSANWTSMSPIYTGTTLTLPPGKWSVQVSILLANGGTCESWVRSTFSNSSSSSSPSGDIIGASLASGYKAYNSNWGMLIGTIIINNTSGANKTYYYWGQNCENYQGSFSFSNFGRGIAMEDQIIAYPMN